MIPQVVGVFISLVFYLFEDTFSRVFATVSLLSFLFIGVFWALFFRAASLSRLRSYQPVLSLLYRLVQLNLIVVLVWIGWGIISNQIQISHLALGAFLLIELTEYAMIRWLDGPGRWFWTRLSRPEHFLGGAMKRALQHAERVG